MINQDTAPRISSKITLNVAATRKKLTRSSPLIIN